MIFGWLRRKKVDAEERREWEKFAAEMEGVLSDVSLLLELDEREQEVVTTDFWRPEYVKMGSRAPSYSFPVMRQPVYFPEPELGVLEPMTESVHQMVNFGFNYRVSDHELMIRRTPAEMMQLADFMRDKIDAAFRKRVCDIARSPIYRAKAIIKQGTY